MKSRTNTVDADIRDTICIHAEGAILTISAMDVVDLIRRAKTLPLVKPRSEKKSCPNPECEGGWVPEQLWTGDCECPVCKTRWRPKQ